MSVKITRKDPVILEAGETMEDRICSNAEGLLSQLEDCQVFDKDLYEANVRKMLEEYGEFDKDGNYDDHGDGGPIQSTLYCIAAALPMDEIIKLCNKFEDSDFERANEAHNTVHWLYEVLRALDVGKSFKDKLKTLDMEDKITWTHLFHQEGFDQLRFCLDEVRQNPSV